MPAAPAGGLQERRNADGTIRVGGLRPGQQWVDRSGNPVQNPSQRDIVLGNARLQQAPAAAGVGPGNVPVGGTDADRAAARPRLEGESDRAYEIRTAPSRDAAVRILNGHQLPGLRAIARDEGVVTSGSKADLIARLMRAMRDRHEDSAAIERMVGAGRTSQAPAAGTPEAPSTPAGALNRLRAIPEANASSLGRAGVADTVSNILNQVKAGQMTRERAADLVAQMVQRYSMSGDQADGGARDRISLILSEIARSLREKAPAPTMTGAQLLAQRRRQ